MKTNDPKEYVTLCKQKSFQYKSDVTGIAYNPFADDSAKGTYFHFERAIVLDFWIDNRVSTTRSDSRGMSGRTVGSRTEGAGEF